MYYYTEDDDRLMAAQMAEKERKNNLPLLENAVLNRYMQIEQAYGKNTDYAAGFRDCMNLVFIYAKE